MGESVCVCLFSFQIKLFVESTVLAQRGNACGWVWMTGEQQGLPWRGDGGFDVDRVHSQLTWEDQFRALRPLAGERESAGGPQKQWSASEWRRGRRGAKEEDSKGSPVTPSFSECGEGPLARLPGFQPQWEPWHTSRCGGIRTPPGPLQGAGHAWMSRPGSNGQAAGHGFHRGHCPAVPQAHLTRATASPVDGCSEEHFAAPCSVAWEGADPRVTVGP